METSINPYAAPSGDIIEDFLLVDGNVNIGKNKGMGQLLFTRNSIFAFRTSNDVVAFAMFGLLGLLISYIIKTYFTKPLPPSPHLTDPEVLALPEKIQKRMVKSNQLAKFPLVPNLQAQRTTLGVKLTTPNAQEVIFQGLMHKGKITQFLTVVGIQVK
jgi:hypothetical protein